MTGSYAQHDDPTVSALIGELAGQAPNFKGPGKQPLMAIGLLSTR